MVATGSSAFELANEINEPLTGRKWEYFLYPIAWSELVAATSAIGAREQLDTRLIFGMYPDIINQTGCEREVLLSLSGSYLYKDVFEFRGVRKPEMLWQLLQALALQLGAEVSYNELSQLLGVDKNTVSNYLDLLEKSYIVFRLMPLSRNLRNEISSNRKVYFYDNGIRRHTRKLQPPGAAAGYRRLVGELPGQRALESAPICRPSRQTLLLAHEGAAGNRLRGRIRRPIPRLGIQVEPESENTVLRRIYRCLPSGIFGSGDA